MNKQEIQTGIFWTAIIIALIYIFSSTAREWTGDAWYALTDGEYKEVTNRERVIDEDSCNWTDEGFYCEYETKTYKTIEKAN